MVTSFNTEAVVANALDDHLSLIDLATWEVRPLERVDRLNGFGFIPVGR
ncbi:MAG: hypothetical protein ACFB15_31460 [Cyclobacteriaceae bacterium]